MDENKAPRPKVAAAGMAGAATTILVYALAQMGLDIPPEVAAACVTLISFGAGYLKSE